MGVVNGEISDEAVSSMAPFSYAQAAKGQVITKAQNITPSSPTSTKGAEEISSMLTNMSSKVNWADEGADSSATDEPQANGETAEVQSRSGSHVAHSRVAEDQVSSPDLGASSTSTMVKDDDASSMPTSASESAWETKSQNSGQADATTSASENTGRGGKGKKDNKEKAPAPKPVPLKEAPIPTVNFWAQRAQDTKAKQTTLPSPTVVSRKGGDSASNLSSPIKDAGQDGKREDLTKSPGFRGQDRASSEKSGTPTGNHERSRSTRGQSSVGQTAVPLVQDQNSWPTPESAQDEERRKPQDRERPAQGSAKPHSKAEWVNMPYTPTVKFETPLPPTSKRGGRVSGRGGRENGGRGGSSASTHHSKQFNTSSTPETTIEGSARARAESNAVTASSQPAPKTKVGVSVAGLESPAHGNNPIGSVTPAAEDSTQAGVDSSVEPVPSADVVSELTETAAPAPPSALVPPSDNGSLFIPPYKHKTNSTKIGEGASTNAEHGEEGRSPTENGVLLNKPQWAERRERPSRPYEGFRDSANNGLPRERAEGRPDRGRGGRGGKNGVNHFNTHHPGGQPGNSQLPTGSPSSHATKNGPPFTAQYHGQPNHYMGPPRGGYRSGPRAASIPTENAYARYPGYAGAGLPPYMDAGIFQAPGMYPGVGSMNPYGEQYMLAETISTQLAYYFSLDNLLKDTFLRSHMDSQGYVALSLLANFSRMRSLTTDTELIKFVCTHSPELELRSGSDGKDRVRKREGWEQWVLAMGERDPAARNEGPPAAEPSPVAAQQSYEPYGARMMNGQGSSPHETRFGEGSYSGYHGMSAPFSPVSVASQAGLTQNAAHARHSMSVVESESFRHGQSTHATRNGHHNAQADADPFPDSQIEFLTVVVRQQGGNPERPPFHSEASRTFSHGSIDATTSIAELKNGDTVEPQPLNVNGSTDEDDEAKSSDRKRSLVSRFPVNATRESPVGLFWIKEKEAPEPLPSGSTYEPYSHLHMKALQQRENAESGVCPYDMDVLYQFWSHFLIRNYNGKMYNEFRQFAHEDASNNSSSTGMNNLIKYYSEALSSQHPIRDRVARHYVELVNAEDPGKDRPAYKQLRSAWRNGALNLKNRKRISDFVDTELRTELER